MSPRKPAPRRSPPVLTISEATGLLGASATRLARELELPTARLGLRTVVFPDALARWASEQGIELNGDPHEVAKPWPRVKRRG